MSAMNISLVPSGELYTGRQGTLPLADFQDLYTAAMAETQMDYPNKFTEEYASLQMPRYIAGEAFYVYREFKNQVLLQHGSTLAEQEPAGEATTERTVVTGTLVDSMFEIFKREFPECKFPSASVEEMEEMTQFSSSSLQEFLMKMEEIKQFAFKPRETLFEAYLRMEQLLEDTGRTNSRHAAEDYLIALPSEHRESVTFALHFTYGYMYNLRQVYEMAANIIPARQYSAAYYERRYGGTRAQWYQGVSISGSQSRRAGHGNSATGTA